MKIQTKKAKERQRLKVAAYEDWLLLKAKGYSMRSACVLIAPDYGVSEATMGKWLAQEAKARGENKIDKTRDLELKERVHRRYLVLRSKGYSKTDACYKISTTVDRCWKTIYNWENEREL